MSGLDSCPHIQWSEDSQYATFRASTKTQYSRERADREVEVIDHDLFFDGEPHLCADDLYVVALKTQP